MKYQQINYILILISENENRRNCSNNIKVDWTIKAKSAATTKYESVY